MLAYILWMFALVKFGGSVITDKSKFGEARKDIIARLCSEISLLKKGVIVHGGGSFGHIKAVKYGFKNGCENRVYFSEIHGDMIKLNEIILDNLLSNNIPAVSIPPHTFYPFGDLKAFRYYIQEGFIPVTYGDVFWKDGKGWIISGDDLMLMISRELRPDIAIFVSDVDGIYEDLKRKKILDVITPEMVSSLKIHDVGDATGGLRKKLEVMFQIAKMGIKTYIVGGFLHNNLRKALKGEDFIGTEVRV